MDIENIVNIEIDAKCNLKMYLPYKEEDYIQRTIWRTKKPYEFEMLKSVLMQFYFSQRFEKTFIHSSLKKLCDSISPHRSKEQDAYEAGQQKIKKQLSYRLGHTLVTSLRLWKIFLLPIILYKDY